MPKKSTRSYARPRPSPRASQTADAAPIPGAPTPEVMTIEQVAVYLDLAVPTLYKKVQAHQIPFTKIGNLLRFTKTSIDSWLARNTFAPPDEIYQQFARLQSRYLFRTWLEGRGVDWHKLTEEQLLELATNALEDLRQNPAAP